MLPQELEVWYVIPAVRSGLVKIMAKQGLKQREIAKKLGLRESAVSQYIKKKRGQGVNLPEKLKEQINKSALSIINNKKTHMEEIQRICRLSRKMGFLKTIAHKMGCDCKGCRACLK